MSGVCLPGARAVAGFYSFVSFVGVMSEHLVGPTAEPAAQTARCARHCCVRHGTRMTIHDDQAATQSMAAAVILPPPALRPITGGNDDDDGGDDDGDDDDDGGGGDDDKPTNEALACCRRQVGGADRMVTEKARAGDTFLCGFEQNKKKKK